MDSIKTIAIAGFKSFGAEVEVPLLPVNVLIGANGSGKSNFLGAFAFLQALSSGCVDDFVTREGGADQILHFGSRNTERLTIRTTFGDSDGYVLNFTVWRSGQTCGRQSEIVPTLATRDAIQ